ncbi:MULTISPECIES: hypothetical protein [Trichocoleus]|uniref:Uncharacterized protein n=1 Tax=Trichocoleus desertorum GB2-A4 TaxID=2933944 RepID=A0ABV0J1S7_9CYAN|nr:hypothetical protein [Trichocoleus sp. FACHB-46]MBD1860345.1 hypothetical protein [Trichocoleus sp. FACHB-46]
MRFLSALIGFTGGLVVAIAPSTLTQATDNSLSYSASLGLPGNYNGPACIQLGHWDGSAAINLEANKFYTGIQVSNSNIRVTKALNININQNLGQVIKLSSDRALYPTLNQGQCKIKSGALQVHSLNWFRR